MVLIEKIKTKIENIVTVRIVINCLLYFELLNMINNKGKTGIKYRP